MARAGAGGSARDARRAVPRARARCGGGSRLRAGRAGWLVGAVLLASYVATLAPGLTFWDAGEFIAAAHGLGIPHPPGTPLYIAVGRAWTLLLGPLLGVARAMNLLSAICTAAAGGVMTWLVARELKETAYAGWAAAAAGISAGLMASVWANATETEVYALALLHGVLMLASATRASEGGADGDGRWLLVTAYLIALAPALHLSALVAAPAAIALASRRRSGRWMPQRVLVLGGVTLIAAGVGRMGLGLVLAGGACVMGAGVRRWRAAEGDAAQGIRPIPTILAAMLAASALLILLVRARHDPAINQGNPASLAALVEVVARRQYDVAGLLPRRAPVWLQLANVTQYADWQVALAWGNGIFTTPARVLATLLFVALAAVGARAMRRDAVRLADALLVLLACGTLGVAAYLNLKAGASLGWGVIPDGSPHEARERDYFFVLGFWAWGCFGGYGAVALARARRWPAWSAVAVAVLPLAGNWRAMDRSREPEASAARDVAHALLESAPTGAVLFAAGDNDSYPIWYAQQVEGLRRDVLLVTLPLLPSDWYAAEIRRRTGWHWPAEGYVPGAAWRHEQQAALIAGAARAAGRPVAATPALTAKERAFLGSAWVLRGVGYQSGRPADGLVEPATVDSAEAARWLRPLPARPAHPPVDDAVGSMLAYLDCPRLALPAPAPRQASRDSLELRCNLR